MKNFYWLVKREFWEHRGGFLWVPVITTGVIVAIDILLVIAGEIVRSNHGIHINNMWDKFASSDPDTLQKIGGVLDLNALIPLSVVSVVMFFVLFVYCMKCLSSDRKDRSILFWKSLPVSDLATVLSKAFSALIVVPVIAIVTSAIGALVVLLVMSIAGMFHGIDFGTLMISMPHTGKLVESIVGILPIYIVWMLPSVGWLMLCSAWASGKVARWAIALPVAIGIILTWLSLIGVLREVASWFWLHVVLRILLGLLPGSWVGNLQGLPHLQISSINGDPVQIHTFAGLFSKSVTWQYHLLWTPEFLWGALAGFIMIGIAIWLRRWRTEL